MGTAFGGKCYECHNQKETRDEQYLFLRLPISFVDLRVLCSTKEKIYMDNVLCHNMCVWSHSALEDGKQGLQSSR